MATFLWIVFRGKSPENVKGLELMISAVQGSE